MGGRGGMESAGESVVRRGLGSRLRVAEAGVRVSDADLAPCPRVVDWRPPNRLFPEGTGRGRDQTSPEVEERDSSLESRRLSGPEYDGRRLDIEDALGAEL